MGKNHKNSRKRLDSNAQKEESQKEVAMDEQTQKKKDKQRKDDEEIQKNVAQDQSKEETKTEVIGDRKLQRQLEKQKRDEEEAAEKQKAVEKNAKKTEKDKHKKQTVSKRENKIDNGRSISRERRSQESDIIYTQCATDVPSSKKRNPRDSEILHVQRALDNVQSSSKQSKSEEFKKDHAQRASNVAPSLKKDLFTKYEESETNQCASDNVASPSQNWRAQKFERIDVSKNADNKDESANWYDETEKKSNWKEEHKWNKNSSGGESALYKSRRSHGTEWTDNDFTNKKRDYRNSSYDNSQYGRKNTGFKTDNAFQRFDNTRKSDGEHYRSGFGGNDDKDFRLFTELLKKNHGINNGKVEQKVGDLFDAPNEYALAHCVAEDMSMGAGIAVQFRNTFRGLADLLDQRVRTGGVAILNRKGRVIYYLVTKNRSQGKPLLYTLWLSLNEMRKHMLQHNVTKLAIPQIGCGLDRLDWSDVKQMLEYIFQNDEIEIVVYSLQDNLIDSKPKPKPKTRVVHVRYPLIDIAPQTALLYLGTEDSFISDEMRSLETKYMNLSTKYMEERKSVGHVIRSEIRNEVLYGLIVKSTVKDELKYLNLEKCLINLKHNLKKDEFYYVGLQAFLDENNTSCMEHIITVMQSVLYDIEIYICWPSELSQYAPISI